MGDITYGLWVHVAPGNDWRFDDIRPRRRPLELDDGSTALAAIKPPALAHGALSAGGFLGANGLFRARSETLKRMAASTQIGLGRQSGRHAVHFAAALDARRPRRMKHT